ncbi:hypothetical protein CYMTET_29227 [Cymbomonas tetramitiformis]|uniref:Uncharacterized protein n=1 Tax=Cymbomonas tetramitiformis TaxID=36881 RepID=A0AAE0FMX6_9CHLO|nr:hypothetical protein CYMTET_29227 [Cymbomonas tetramitiformis]
MVDPVAPPANKEFEDAMHDVLGPGFMPQTESYESFLQTLPSLQSGGEASIPLTQYGDQENLEFNQAILSDADHCAPPLDPNAFISLTLDEADPNDAMRREFEAAAPVTREDLAQTTVKKASVEELELELEALSLGTRCGQLADAPNRPKSPRMLKVDNFVDDDDDLTSEEGDWVDMSAGPGLLTTPGASPAAHVRALLPKEESATPTSPDANPAESPSSPQLIEVPCMQEESLLEQSEALPELVAKKQPLAHQIPGVIMDGSEKELACSTEIEDGDPDDIGDVHGSEMALTTQDAAPDGCDDADGVVAFALDPDFDYDNITNLSENPLRQMKLDWERENRIPRESR